ncbi:MAG: flagellar biosynthesis protein FlhB [Alphaproteobacteria bacterium]
MSDSQDDSQKTEDPTQRRLEDARRKGQVAVSREVNSWLMLLAGAVVVGLMAPSIMSGLTGSLTGYLSHGYDLGLTIPDLRAGVLHTVLKVAVVLVPVISLLLIAAVLGGLLQNGFMLTAESVQPKLEKISPAKGFKRLFSSRALVEFTKGLVKIGLVTTVITILVMPILGRIELIAGMAPGPLLGELHALVIKVLIGVIAIMAIVAVLDLLYQRQQHTKQMRMSRQDLKDEFRQTDGDPIVKARLRQIRSERARRRMMAAVPEADVVITNPTHFACALKYDIDSMDAPVLVAKGVDHVAKRIRELAQSHHIPVVENPPLARALHAGVDLDREVPPEHYRAVAEVIGYVMRLKGQGRR